MHHAEAVIHLRRSHSGSFTVRTLTAQKDLRPDTNAMREGSKKSKIGNGHIFDEEPEIIRCMKTG